MVPITDEMQSWLTLQRQRFLQLLAGFPRVGPKGFEIFVEDELVPQTSHVTVGREGYIEAAVMMDRFNRNNLASRPLTDMTMQFLRFCGLMYERLSYSGIVRLFLGVDQVGKLQLAVNPKHWFAGSAKLQANEVHVYRNEAAASLRTDDKRICKLFMDRVYQAAGLMSCDHFNADGELLPPANR